MSTKLNAEQMAEKEYPIDFQYPCGIEIMHTVQDVQEAQQIAYQRAIEEVAQPIADERDELVELLREMEQLAQYTEGFEVLWTKYDDILAKYHKNP